VLLRVRQPPAVRPPVTTSGERAGVRGRPRRAVWFRIVAFAFALTACFHLVAAGVPDLDPAAPAWRHLLFVGINLVCIAGFLARPLLFIPPFALLVVQQVASHGSSFLSSLAPGERIDLPSLAVVLVMPTTLVLLLIDRFERR
jgi:hypothetical protein